MVYVPFSVSSGVSTHNAKGLSAARPFGDVDTTSKLMCSVLN